MHRELGDERSRYGRKSLREQFADALAWPGTHRGATAIVLLLVLGGALLYLATARPLDRRDLAVGDCLYVPTDAAKDPTTSRPIGESGTVEDVILASGAERTNCTASHGHEVSAIVVTPEPSRTVGAIGTPFDRNALRRLVQPFCEAAFAGYIDHGLAGSRYMTFPIAPEPHVWVGDGRQAVCLVARTDGGWMDHPARGSGE